MQTVHNNDDGIEIIDRVRYHRRTRRPVLALTEAGATSRENARYSSEVGLVPTPYSWWLERRGVIRRTGSGKYWLNVKRQEELQAGAHIRVAIYLAVAGLFSGASMAMASAGF
ncbi:MAG: hypothetical protein ACIAQ0_05820 [Phycisphaerales bacterium JB058]